MGFADVGEGRCCGKRRAVLEGRKGSPSFREMSERQSEYPKSERWAGVFGP